MALIMTGGLTNAGFEARRLMPSGPSATFGRRFREARRSANLSQQAIASLTKIPQWYISAMERGKQNPTLDTMTRLAVAVGKPLVELLQE